MNYISIHNLAKKLLWSLVNVEKQWKYYELQRKGIGDLKNSEWYKYLVEYLHLEVENATQSLYSIHTPKESIPYFQGKCQTAIDLLDFLDNE